MNNIGIIITVRAKSNRIKEKCNQKINGRTALDILLSRLDSRFLVDYKLVVAVPNGDMDVVANTSNAKPYIFEGSKESPLHRIAEAIEHYKFDHVVRITADDILIDPQLLKKQIDFHLNNKLDYTYLGRCPTGIAGEVISAKAILKVAKQISEPCEFISYYLKEPEFEYKEYYPPMEYQKVIRVCLDYKEDLMLMRNIFELLGDDFGTLDLINLFRNKPKLFNVNSLPKVTFYTCNYNQSDFIAETIISVLAQDVDFEYIIYNDGSTDDSLQVICNLISMQPQHVQDRVKVVSTDQNNGLGYSSNKCLDMAKGRYIMRVDADDSISHGYVSRLLSEIDNHKAIMSGYNRGGQSRTSKHYHSGCCLMSTRHAQEIRYKKDLNFAKGTTFLKEFEKDFKIKFIQEALWHYRWHSNSITAKETT